MLMLNKLIVIEYTPFATPPYSERWFIDVLLKTAEIEEVIEVARDQ